MPNYGLVVTPTYNPISYEQYVAPFREYAQVYNTMAEAFDTLETEASVWEKLKDSPKDSPQYQAYLNYKNGIGEVTREMAEHGLTSKLRGKLSEFRRRYGAEIQPIAEAWARREKEIELQKQGRLQNPTIFYDRLASETGLGAYMGQTPELKTSSGELLRSYSANAAKNLAKEIRQNPEKWNTILGGQYFSTSHSKGLTDKQILASLRNSDGTWKKEAVPALLAIGNQVLTASGMPEWNNFGDLENDAWKYIELGYWDAIGETSFDHLSNKYYDWQLNERSRRNAAKEAERKERELKLLAINPANIYTNEEMSKQKESMLNIDKYIEKGYIKRNADGSLSITKEGFKEYQKDEQMENYDPSGMGYYGVKSPTFKNLIDGLGVHGKKNNSGKIVISEKDINNALTSHYTKNQDAYYDATKSTEYIYRFKDGDKFRDNFVIPNLMGNDLQEVNFSRKDNKYHTTGKTMSASNLSNSRITDARMTANGTVISVVDSNGETKRYLLDPGINSRNEQARDKHLQNAENIRIAISRLLQKYGSNASNLREVDVSGWSPYDIQRYALLVDNYYLQLTNAYEAMSQLEVTNETKTQQFEPVGY